MSYVDQSLMSKAAAAKGGMAVGETVEGVYMGYEEVYDEKYLKNKVNFKIRTDAGGMKKIGTSSGKVMEKFAVVAPGSRIAVTKLGAANATDYRIQILAVGGTNAISSDTQSTNQPAPQPSNQAMPF